MNPLGRISRRRRARHFADVLAGRADPRADEVELVERTHALLAAAPQARTPDPQLRARLVVAARTELSPLRSRRPAMARPRLRWGAAELAAALALAGIVGSGLGFLLDHAVPGDPLYAAKRGVERVDLLLPGSPTTEADRRLALADTRLAEIRRVAADGLSGADVAVVAGLMRDWTAQAAPATRVLLADAADGDEAAAQRLQNFVAGTRAGLAPLTGALPPQLNAAAAPVLATLNRAAEGLAMIGA